MSTRQFAVIDPAEGVLFRAPYFDDALLDEPGSQVLGVLTLPQVQVVIDVVRRLNHGLTQKEHYHAHFLHDRRIAPINENGLVSKELLPIAAAVGIVTAKASLVEFREQYASLISASNIPEQGSLLAA